jgi:hypothetical protein
VHRPQASANPVFRPLPRPCRTRSLLQAGSGSIRCLGISQHSKESKGPFVRKATSTGTQLTSRPEAPRWERSMNLETTLGGPRPSANRRSSLKRKSATSSSNLGMRGNSSGWGESRVSSRATVSNGPLGADPPAGGPAAEGRAGTALFRYRVGDVVTGCDAVT